MSLNVAETQQVLFDILVYFDKLSVKHNFMYWIDGGTLLGAKRNGKYIPWDDDVDVCVFQSDYDKIISILQDEVPKSKKYLLYNSCRKTPHFTEYLGDYTFLKGKNKLPVQLDIIRIKKIKNTEESISLDTRMVNLFKYYLHRPYDSDLNSGFPEERFLKDPKFRKRSLFYDSFINDYLANLPKGGDGLLYNYAYNASYVNKDREYYIEEDILPLSTIEFEGKDFPCPGNVNAYLTKLYGKDYLLPPDKKFQVPSSAKSIKNFFPRSLTKRWVYVIFYLKEIMNNYRMKKKLKHESK